MAKYKNIQSAIHNWAHSFMSIENHDEKGFYFVGELYKAAKKARATELSINVMSGEISPDRIGNERIQAFLATCGDRLVSQLNSQNVDQSMLSSVRLHIQYDFSAPLAEQRGFYFAKPEQAPPAASYTTEIVAIDIRGKEHSSKIREWWYV